MAGTLNKTVDMVVNATANATNATPASNITGNMTSLLNTTLSKAASAASAAQSFVPLVLLRLWELIAAPFRHAEMLWIILPLFFTLFVMEFYYDRHDDEEMGWGAALANSLVLIFVTIDLIKRSFADATPWSVLRTITLSVFTDAQLPLEPQVLILILFVGALGLAITAINYFHLLPRKLAFILSHHASSNYLAYFAIAIVYSTATPNPIPFDLAALIAGAILFILLLLLVFGIKKLFRRITGTRGRFGGRY
jgi:hypothetical protein